MRSLLKADFYRVIKSKLFYTAIIISVLAPIIIVALYFGLYSLVDEENVKSTFSAVAVYHSSFSVSNNVGIVVSVFSAIFVVYDITTGTLRNKIINGKNRFKIYCSHLIVSSLFNLFIIIIYSSFTLLFSLIFFNKNFNFNADTKTVIYFVITGFVSFMFVATLTTLFALVTRSLPLTILLTILLTMLLSIGLGIVSAIDISNFKYLIYLIPTYSNLVMPTTNEIFICGLISYAIFGTINVVVGMIVFKLRDIK